MVDIVHLIQDILPWIILAIIAVGTWMFRQILNLNTWTAKAEEWHKTDVHRAAMAEKAAKSLTQHSERIDALKEDMKEIKEGMGQCFQALENHLGRMEDRCINHLRQLSRQNGLKLPKEIREQENDT